MERIKNFKNIFPSHLENIEKEFFLNLKGLLTQLNYGHILFYNEGELETLKYIIKESIEGSINLLIIIIFNF